MAGQIGRGVSGEGRGELPGHDFAELHPPLVERVDAPDRPLREHDVLVERHELAEGGRRQLRGKDGRARPVAGHHLVRDGLGRRAVGGDLLGRPPEGENRALREAVRHQQVVLIADLVIRLGESDEVRRDEPRALMEQLIEGMLAVGARFAPEDLPGLVVDARPVEPHRLAVRLHRQLLQVGGEPRQPLAVGEHGVRLGAEEVDIPEVQQSLDDGQALIKGCLEEVLVHGAKPRQHLGEGVLPDRDHQREADGRVVGVTSSHPVPEAEHVPRVDPEGCDSPLVGGYCDEVLGHRVVAGAKAAQ